MSLVNQVSSLSAALSEKARQAAETAQSEAAARISLAQAYDARMATLGPSDVPRAVPNFVHPHSYRSTCTAGSIWYEAQSADICAQVMRDFPPVPLFYARSTARNQSGFYIAQDLKPEFDSRIETDGFYMSASRFDYRDEIAIEWTTELHPGYLVQFKVRLSAVHGLTPRITGRIVESGGVIHRIENQSLSFPVSTGADLRTFAYAAHKPDAWKDFRAYGSAGSGVGAYVEGIAAELTRRGVETYAAYLADKQSGHLRAEPTRDRTGLRAGSAAQTAALASDAALADRALAEKHWQAYVRDSRPDEWPTKSRQNYFDHYAWACKYLQSVGLLEDPELITEKGKPYRYGSAWL